MLKNVSWLWSHPAAIGRRVSVLSRWIYWQVRQRLTSRPLLMDFLHNTRLMIYPHEGLTGYWYLMRPDYEESLFLEKFLRRDDVFFDVGANAGAYSVLASGLGCRVVAFEPVPFTFARLVENAKLNDVSRMVLQPCAIGSTNSTLRMSVRYGTGNHVLQDGETADFVEVEVKTLDQVISEIPVPTFIKVDIEGFELEMLRGALELLKSDKLLGLLLETFRPHNWQDENLRSIEALLSQYGFEPYRYDVHKNQVELLERPQDGDNNTLYLRAKERVDARLAGHGV